MGLLSKIFGIYGIEIGPPPWWEIGPPSDIALFIENLPVLLPSESILYFEGTLDTQVAHLLRAFEISNPVPIQKGTIWPKLDVHHTTMTNELLKGIGELIRYDVAPYPSIHFHAYKEKKVLLEWHDAFNDDPMLVSVDIDEENIKDFCNIIKSSYTLYEKPLPLK